MCPPRLRHHVRRALHASAGGTRVCLGPAILCGEHCALLLAAHTRVTSAPPLRAECAARFCRRHTLVTASASPPCAESAARFYERHTLRDTHVSASSSPPSCAGSASRRSRFSGARASRRSRFCRRHTQVSASPPPPCAESGARFFGRHTHVTASSPPPCTESAARIFRRHSHVPTSSPESATVRGERCALLRAAHTCDRLVSAFMCGVRLRSARTSVRSLSAIMSEDAQRVMRAAHGPANCLHALDCSCCMLDALSP